MTDEIQNPDASPESTRESTTGESAEPTNEVSAEVTDALVDPPVEPAAESEPEPETESEPEPDSAPEPQSDTDPAPMAVPRASAEVKAIVEALVFASPEPLTPKVLYKLLADEPKEEVAAALNALRAEYNGRPGLQLVEVAGGYQIVTRPELHEWVRRLFHERSTQKLSVQALESLAVIAYKQPITALEVTEIRGVNASGVLTTLLERGLVKIVGRKNVVGRPFMYATTREFLIRFGLKDLTELPRIEDMAEALGFDPPAGLLERTATDEMLPLEGPVTGESLEGTHGPDLADAPADTALTDTAVGDAAPVDTAPADVPADESADEEPSA